MGLLSKLDAVNRILRRAGEYPVSTLVGEVNDTTVAEAVLDEQVRKIQQQGTTYNTSTKQYTPDVNGRIFLPSDTLSADGAYTDYSRGLSVRGGTTPYLYDTVNQTDVFTKGVYLRVVRLLSFEDLPDADQEWATDAAALVYYADNVGNPAEVQTLMMAAETSRAKARAEEIRRLDASFLNSSATERIGSRRYYRNNL